MGRLRLPDIQFCLGVEKISGVIHAEQGIPLFYCPAKGIIALYPASLTADDYGTMKIAYVYNDTNKLRLRLDRDDVPNNRMTEYDLDLLTQFKELEAMVEEAKIRMVPKVMASYASIIMLTLAAILFYIFREHIPMFWAVEGAVIFVGVLSLMFAISQTKTINSVRIYDSCGLWVNMETGETNLNGGYKLPRGKEAGLL